MMSATKNSVAYDPLAHHDMRTDGAPFMAFVDHKPQSKRMMDDVNFPGQSATGSSVSYDVIGHDYENDLNLPEKWQNRYTGTAALSPSAHSASRYNPLHDEREPEPYTSGRKMDEGRWATRNSVPYDMLGFDAEASRLEAEGNLAFRTPRSPTHSRKTVSNRKNNGYGFFCDEEGDMVLHTAKKMDDHRSATGSSVSYDLMDHESRLEPAKPNVGEHWKEPTKSSVSYDLMDHSVRPIERGTPGDYWKQATASSVAYNVLSHKEGGSYVGDDSLSFLGNGNRIGKTPSTKSSVDYNILTRMEDENHTDPANYKDYRLQANAAANMQPSTKSSVDYNVLAWGEGNGDEYVPDEVRERPANCSTDSSVQYDFMAHSSEKDGFTPRGVCSGKNKHFTFTAPTASSVDYNVLS